MEVEVPQWDALDQEARDVWANRYQEALQAGMTQTEAATFAASDIDIGQLRHLVALGCDRQLVAGILL